MIYLDNNATTSVAPQVVEAMKPYYAEEYGNPSSKYYTLARNAQAAVENAREQVAKLINAKPKEIIFTCGATESNNTIIKGIADYRKYYEEKGNHIITSKVEHHATLNTCRFLNGEIYSNKDAIFSLDGENKKIDRGFAVSFLDVNPCGCVEPQMVEQAIRDDTTIASIIWANNEIGTINDIAALAAVAKKRGVFFHSDATQRLGKLPIDVDGLEVDALSFSAHKLNGPKGVGALYVRAGRYGLPQFSSLMHGGEQENGIRGGTLNVPQIVGFGEAARLSREGLADSIKSRRKMDREIISLLNACEWIELIGDPAARLPGIFSIVVGLPAFHNELFMKYVGDRIAISAGSACTVGEPSHVLQAMGRGDQTGKVLRISGGNLAEIEMLLSEIQAFSTL